MNKKTNYFINIVLDCSFDHEFYQKRYSTLEQVLITVRSIQRNWDFPYRINLIYTSVIDEETTKILNDLNIDLYYVKPEIETETCSLSRSASYSLQLNRRGTHRLVIDCDMVATNNLQIEKLLKYDIACMYEWCTNVCKTQESYDSLILDLCNTFSFKHPSSRFVCSDNSWASDYHLTGKKLACPFYNPGVVFMKEELTSEFAKRYKQLWSLGASQKLQVGMSIAMQELTTNIGTLEPGTNILPYLLTSSDKFKNFRNTYLLHCCVSSYDTISKLCDFYLTNPIVMGSAKIKESLLGFHAYLRTQHGISNASNPNPYHWTACCPSSWEGEEYYFNQTLELSAPSKQMVRDIDDYYNRQDINIHTEGM